MRAPIWRSVFPRSPNAPLNEERVCQYENSSNGDLLIDRHPTAAMCCWSARARAMGSSTGPRSGRYAAELLTGKLKKVEPRFSLAIEGRAAEPRRALSGRAG